jgi:hypothetical protein
VKDGIIFSSLDTNNGIIYIYKEVELGYEFLAQGVHSALPFTIENIYTEFFHYTLHNGMVLKGLNMLNAYTQRANG